MLKDTYNIIAKRVKGHEYIMTDLIATKLTRNQFEKIKQLNQKLFEDYYFIPYKETDFTWWAKITKYLTTCKLYHNQCFEIDYFGNITRY